MTAQELVKGSGAPTATDPKCPHCGGTRTYRMWKFPEPLGENRMCEECWRKFRWQTPEQQERMDRAVAQVTEQRRLAIERINRQIAAKKGTTIPLAPVPAEPAAQEQGR